MNTLPDPFAGWFAARGWRPHRHQLDLLVRFDDRPTYWINPDSRTGYFAELGIPIHTAPLGVAHSGGDVAFVSLVMRTLAGCPLEKNAWKR